MMDGRKMPGATESLWNPTPMGRPRPALTGPAEADVCVVGGGIAGLSTAYQLAGEGKSVIVLEDGRIGGGETGRTTAHLASALDDRFTHLEKLHGGQGARLAAESHMRAIDEIESIVRREDIACSFERLDGYLFQPPGEDPRRLDEELEAARRAGHRDATREARAPMPDFDTGPCLRFPGQGQFHPLEYLRGLAAAAERRGARIHESTHVTSVQGGGPAVVRCANGAEVRAGAVVVATNAPITSRVQIPLKNYPYRSYVLAFRVPEGAIPKALYWDTADPYHYVRLQGPFLIVGGEDHKTGHDEGVSIDVRFGRLEHWTRERFRSAGEIVHAWSGQVMEPADSLAYIGRHKASGENVYLATGDSGHGMTHGTIAGMLLRDLIVGRANPWAELYDPGRSSLRSPGEVLRENLSALAGYGRWLTPGDVASCDGIMPGHGAVVREGLRKVACYREEDGTLRRMSAVCPHLGAVVRWNEGERTWDCPAHGSRFTATGRVVNGPARGDLSPAPGAAARERVRVRTRTTRGAQRATPSRKRRRASK